MSPQTVDGFNGIDGIGWESVCTAFCFCTSDMSVV
jgi:hypothetical protein